MSSFDAEKAFLHGADDYPRYRVPDAGSPVPDSLDGERDMLLIERGGKALAFTLESLAYHHVAQGELGGQPYVVAFCVICHSGVGHDPRIDGKVHHFSAGGLYNGLMLMIDDETQSYWNHVTGECVYGPLKGKQLQTFNVEVCTLNSARKRHPAMTVALPKESRFWLKRVIQDFLSRQQFRNSKGKLPPHFPKTFESLDTRREAMDHGLGVVVDGSARYYPFDAIKAGEIKDDWGGRTLRVYIDPDDHLPHAQWEDSGEAPRQIFTRWYGFSFTYKNCAIYGE